MFSDPSLVSSSCHVTVFFFAHRVLTLPKCRLNKQIKEPFTNEEKPATEHESFLDRSMFNVLNPELEYFGI